MAAAGVALVQNSGWKGRRMRRFNLVRSKDISGVSGIGQVAEGIEFDTGKVVICWVSKYHSIGIFDTIHELEMIHGHEGSSKVEWIDGA